MPSVTRIPLCQVSYCPSPSDESWHRCLLCGSNTIEHHHTQGRGRNLKKKKLVVALCVPHHQAISLNKWFDTMVLGPDGEPERYSVMDRRGKTIHEVKLRSAAAEDYTKAPGAIGAISLVAALSGEAEEAEGRTKPSLSAPGSKGSASWLPASPALTSSLEDWMEEGRCLRDEGLHLRKLTTEWAFRVGTWGNTGELTWPHESPPMTDELGLSYWQITKFASVAARVPPENRLSRDMSIEHYRAVAPLPLAEQREWLERAAVEGMTASALKRSLAPTESVPDVCVCPNCGKEHRRA